MANLKILELPALGSIYGGKIPVHFNENQQLVPDKSAFKVRFSVSAVEDVKVNQVIRGVVHIQGEAESFIKRFYKVIVSVLVRESGF
jgi:hypothetical protein